MLENAIRCENDTPSAKQTSSTKTVNLLYSFYVKKGVSNLEDKLLATESKLRIANQTRGAVTQNAFETNGVKIEYITSDSMLLRQ
jgi:hypothetical protein